MDGGEFSSMMTYGGVSYGGEPDCSMRNAVIAIIILYLLYVYVYIPNQTTYDDGSTYYSDCMTNGGNTRNTIR
jgi:hypothetical protein